MIGPLRITGFVWLPSIVEKIIAKHSVLPEEAEHIVDKPMRVRYVENGHVPGEDVYAAHGQTDGGRYLVVFFIWKKDGSALVVSARQMTRRERRGL